MKHILSAFYAKPLSIYLGAALIAVSAFARRAEAMFPPAAQTTEIPRRSADLVKIQRALESKTLQQSMMDHGLAPENTIAKINGLPDEQVHRLAANNDALQTGGRGAIDNRTVIIVLLLVLIIVILVQNTACEA